MACPVWNGPSTASSAVSSDELDWHRVLWRNSACIILPFIFSFLTKLWHQSDWTVSDANSPRKVFLFWNLSHFSGDEPKMYNGAAAYLISTLGHASFAVIPVRLHCVVNLCFCLRHISTLNDCYASANSDWPEAYFLRGRSSIHYQICEQNEPILARGKRMKVE